MAGKKAINLLRKLVTNIDGESYEFKEQSALPTDGTENSGYFFRIIKKERSVKDHGQRNLLSGKYQPHDVLSPP